MVLGRELRVWLLSHGTRATSDLLSGAVIARRAGAASSVTAAVTGTVAAAGAGVVAFAVAGAPAKNVVTATVAAVGAAVVAAVVAVAIAITCQPPPIACATDSTRDHWRMRRETCLLVVWELPTADRREHGDVDEHPAHRSGRATAMLDRHARSQTGAPAYAAASATSASLRLKLGILQVASEPHATSACRPR